jgi:hypothetical protein
LKKYLTLSAINRQNILNNKVTLEGIQEYIGVSGMFSKNTDSQSPISDFLWH